MSKWLLRRFAPVLKPLTMGQIAEATGGTLSGDSERSFSSVTTDSRTVEPGSLFVALVGVAIFTRKHPDWHKRLVLLATLHILWPAFFRLRHWFPAVPDPEIWLALVLAYSPILIAAARDRRMFGKVHPVWLLVAPALVTEQIMEMALFDRGIQKAFGQWLFALLV